jgi:PPOX class probable F420-dependent enzyme
VTPPAGYGDFTHRLQTAPVARLATVRPDGRPHIVPITFALTGESLVTAVDRKPKRTTDLQRLRNIAAHPQVSVLVDGYDDDWSQLWWVRLDGPAGVIVGGSERTAALAALLSKYPQYRTTTPDGPVIAITVTNWTGWSAS